MKRLLILTALVMNALAFAAEPENPFVAEEQRAAEAAEMDVQRGPGNPDGTDDLPIDDYLPALAAAGVAIAVYGAVRSRKLKQA